MATREENIKKINEKLEQMSDEQLEQVAGGTRSQSTRDAYFLEALLKGTGNEPKQPIVDKELFGILRSSSMCEDGVETVKKAWDVLGIEFTEHFIGPNDYVVKDTGENLTQARAWTYASKLMGRE